MNFDERLEDALKSVKPFEQLHRFALELARNGLSQEELYQIFDSFRAKLRLAGKENDQDVVMDVMDCIVGWCAPEYKIFSEYLIT